jgi:hypothetical protein
MVDEWCSRQELVNIVRQRLNASIGRSEAIVKAALASGEVRGGLPPPAIIGPDDSLIDFDMRPEELLNTVIRPYSKDDFLDWLDRYHAPQTTTQQTEQHRYPGDADLIEEGRKLFADGLSKRQAAAKLAPRARGGSIEQRTERLRKLI